MKRIISGKNAFLFPGFEVEKPVPGSYMMQNQQKFTDFFEEIEDRSIFPFSFKDIMFADFKEGTSQELQNQIALFLINARYDHELKSAGIYPDVTYGYSSGIYSAVCSAGSITVEDGASLVLKAWELMNHAVLNCDFGMISITGLTLDKIRNIVISSSKTGILSVSNINSDRQHFLSGEKSALDRAMKLCQQPGLLNARWLPLNVPYHSQLLKNAAVEFRKYITSIEVYKPDIPVVRGCDGHLVEGRDEMIDLIADQFIEKVNVPSCLSKLTQLSIENYWEIGSETFVSKLVRREPAIQSLIQVDNWLNSN